MYVHRTKIKIYTHLLGSRSSNIAGRIQLGVILISSRFFLSSPSRAAVNIRFLEVVPTLTLSAPHS